MRQYALRGVHLLRSINRLISTQPLSQTALRSIAPGTHQWPHAWLSVAAAVAATLTFGQIAVSECQATSLDKDTVQELVEGLKGDAVADRERAVAALSGLTAYVDYHEQLLHAGMLEALIDIVLKRDLPVMLRTLSLGCVADLLQDQATRKAVFSNQAFIDIVLHTLKGDTDFGMGMDGDDVSRSHAARVASELAEDPSLHSGLLSSGLVAVLEEVAVKLAVQSSATHQSYTSDQAVPGSLNERKLVEEEQMVAAAWSALAATEAGRAAALDSKHKPTRALALWARSGNAVLARYAFGALARLTKEVRPVQVAQLRQQLKEVEVVPLLLMGLSQTNDGQTFCYAAAAVGHVTTLDHELAEAVAQLGALQQLLAVIGAAAPLQGVSTGVWRGVLRCALRALLACCNNSTTRAALTKLEAAKRIEVSLKSPLSASQDLQSLGSEVLQALQRP